MAKERCRRPLKADADASQRGLKMLSGENRSAFKAQKARLAGTDTLNLADLAVEADAYWAGRIRSMGKETDPLSFRGFVTGL
jgi:hypothetical protein